MKAVRAAEMGGELGVASGSSGNSFRVSYEILSYL